MERAPKKAEAKPGREKLEKDLRAAVFAIGALASGAYVTQQGSPETHHATRSKAVPEKIVRNHATSVHSEEILEKISPSRENLSLSDLEKEIAAALASAVSEVEKREAVHTFVQEHLGDLEASQMIEILSFLYRTGYDVAGDTYMARAVEQAIAEHPIAIVNRYAAASDTFATASQSDLQADGFIREVIEQSADPKIRTGLEIAISKSSADEKISMLPFVDLVADGRLTTEGLRALLQGSAEEKINAYAEFANAGYTTFFSELQNSFTDFSPEQQKEILVRVPGFEGWRATQLREIEDWETAMKNETL